jgi:hypothetical protein
VALVQELLAQELRVQESVQELVLALLAQELVLALRVLALLALALVLALLVPELLETVLVLQHNNLGQQLFLDTYIQNHKRHQNIQYIHNQHRLTLLAMALGQALAQQGTALVLLVMALVLLVTALVLQATVWALLVTALVLPATVLVLQATALVLPATVLALELGCTQLDLFQNSQKHHRIRTQLNCHYHYNTNPY